MKFLYSKWFRVAELGLLFCILVMFLADYGSSEKVRLAQSQNQPEYLVSQTTSTTTEYAALNAQEYIKYLTNVASSTQKINAEINTDLYNTTIKLQALQKNDAKLNANTTTLAKIVKLDSDLILLFGRVSIRQIEENKASIMNDPVLAESINQEVRIIMDQIQGIIDQRNTLIDQIIR